MEWLAMLVACGSGVGIAGMLVFRLLRRDPDVSLAEAEAAAAAVRAAAERDAAALRRVAEADARRDVFALRDTVEKELAQAWERLDRQDAQAAKREAQLEDEAAEVARRIDELKARDAAATATLDAARAVRGDAEKRSGDGRAALERAAGATFSTVKRELVDGWLDSAKAEAAQIVRLVDQNPNDPEWGREAKRIMGIAIHRYQGHYLTERLLSNIPLPPGMAGDLAANDALLLRAIEAGSGVKLELAETGEKVRIDSGDGVAREIARRALAKIIKGTAPKTAQESPQQWVEQIGAQLDREIVELGRRAFQELEIPRAHPDIVKLVGKLNYRTSYTQNQWKHAIEAAFIGGMMAAEMGLDVKLARRATLMHDIGKALTHEIEGSHAVIGADYARRLGESEVVANAIGAHHADEPPNSTYAFLVAAADAMSGARPGARREQTESYSTKLEDLERIGYSFRGVDEAVAVQGGREVRVYVREKEISDLRAVELSSEIARKISDEMTFPGQIKVTVIRNFEAAEIAN